MKIHIFILNTATLCAWLFMLASAAFSDAVIPVGKNAPLPVIGNPYEGVDWENCARHKANFHARTTESSGRITPRGVMERYKELGYTVLSITDHDRVTYPWTDFAADPEELKMTAVPGAKPSRHHQIGTYFCSVPGRELIEESLADVREQEGLAVLFYPERYCSAGSCTGLYKKWDELIGMEVYNRGDRHPRARVLWDDVLTALMPEKPVWGFSNDDMHSVLHIGLNRNILLLDELSPEKVKTALEKGQFYFSRVSSVYDEAPVINAIEVKNSKITVKASGYDEIVWVSNGREIHRDKTIDIHKTEGVGSYVRARLSSCSGWSYTQPFSTGIKVPMAAYMNITAADRAVVVIDNYIKKRPIRASITIEIDGKILKTRVVDIAPWGKSVQSFILPFIMQARHTIKANIELLNPDGQINEKIRKLTYTGIEIEKSFDFEAHTKVPIIDFTITPDGDLSEWGSVEAVRIGRPGEISADIRLASDERWIYLSAEVNDSEHHNARQGSGIWNGDSLQFAFVPAKNINTEAFNLGLALASNEIQMYQWMGPDLKILQKSTGAVIRDDKNKKTFYEIKILLESLNIPPDKGAVFGFNAVVFNDDDGEGYDYWIEITPGIAGGWNPQEFGKFILWD